ncbi:MAG: BMP family ABC transporter substrate-binding protein, partial [Niameybacter sp.]
ISGLKEEAVGYSVEGSNVVLPQEMIDIVEEIKVKIINGEVVPCGNADELEEWVKNNQYTAQ